MLNIFRRINSRPRFRRQLHIELVPIGLETSDQGYLRLQKADSQNIGLKRIGLKSIGPKSIGPKNIGPKNIGPKNIGPKNIGKT